MDYVGEQPLMRVLAAFLKTSRPRYLRELVVCCRLSPGGVADILRRLHSLGILEQSKFRNRKYYSLQVDNEERAALNELFSLVERLHLQERAKIFSKTARSKLAWMDEASAFFSKVKKAN